MNRKILTTVLLSCFLFNGQLQSHAATKAEELRVFSASQKHNLPECIRACDLILAKEPDNYVALMHHGLCIVWGGDLKRGHKELVRTMQLHPGRPEIRDHLTNTYMMLGKMQEALAQAEYLHQLEPNAACGYLAKARVFTKLKRYKESLACIELAERDPRVDVNEALTLKIIGLAMLGQFREAETELKRAKPGQLHWWQLDSVASDALGERKFAAAIFIVDHSPTKLTAEQSLFVLTYSHAVLGHQKEAELYMRLLAKINPHNVGARHLLAHMYQPDTSPKMILQHLSFIKPAARDAEQWTLLYLCHMQVQAFDEAVKDLSALLAIQHEDLDLVDTYTKRANLYFMECQSEKAIADYTCAIKLSPYDRELYRHRSEAYEDIGDTAHARADVMKSQSLGSRRHK